MLARYNEGMDEVLAMGELDVANVTHRVRVRDRVRVRPT